MKKCKFICSLVVIVLVSICFYQSAKKEDVYITFIDIPGYQSIFIDSTSISKTSKVLIKQSGKLSYQWWEIDIDSAEITKTDMDTYRKLVINSQYMIINNFGGIKDCERTLDRFRFFVLKWENNIPYIMPVKQVRYVME